MCLYTAVPVLSEPVVSCELYMCTVSGRASPGLAMSSEKFEIAQDELDTALEQLQASLAQLQSSQGEARKRLVQVAIENS